MAHPLYYTVKTLWFYYTCGYNINQAVRETMQKGLFRYFESCLVSIEYWFNQFRRDFPFFNLVWMQLASTALRISFLKELVKNLPSWKINFYMDALKTTRSCLYADMKIIGYVYCRRKAKWTKRRLNRLRHYRD